MKWAFNAVLLILRDFDYCSVLGGKVDSREFDGVTPESYPCYVSLQNGLARWAKQIENGVYLINGQVKAEGSDLLEGQVS